MASQDTIVALATGSLPSAIAVIRISGPLASRVLSQLVSKPPEVGRLAVRKLFDPISKTILDEGMVVFFRGPHSFTGEDSAELNVHGSRAVVDGILKVLTAIDGVRLARPGEFTRRAFEAGKLDHIQVEGLGDLIAADTESQRSQAFARLDGALSEKVNGWRALLLGLLAQAEALLDFGDESDVGEANLDSWRAGLNHFFEELGLAIASYQTGRIRRDGFRVALLGAPNAGKSSILNVLSCSNAAIVTAEIGTTRDLNEVMVDIKGDKFVFIDSAGLRDAPGLAEAEGVRRSLELIDNCDLVLEVVSVDTDQYFCSFEGKSNILRVGNKCDKGDPGSCDYLVSCKTEQGFTELIEAVRDMAGLSSVHAPSAILSRKRDLEAASSARESVARAIRLLEEKDTEQILELYSEELGVASRCLERLLGKHDPELVLDELFSSFCIGK